MAGTCIPKQELALRMLQDQPLAWFRDAGVDMRDIDLIRAERVPWLDYDKGSFLRKIVSLRLKCLPLNCSDLPPAVSHESRREIRNGTNVLRGTTSPSCRTREPHFFVLTAADI